MPPSSIQNGCRQSTFAAVALAAAAAAGAGGGTGLARRATAARLGVFLGGGGGGGASRSRGWVSAWLTRAAESSAGLSSPLGARAPRPRAEMRSPTAPLLDTLPEALPLAA